MRASAKVTGDKELQRALGAMIAASRSVRPALVTAGAVMQREVSATFRAQADPVTGAPWPATGGLAMSTRAGGGGGGKTLRDTGALLNSLVSGQPNVTEGPTPSVSIGTTLVYANTHQNGAIIRPRRAKMLAIPATRTARITGSASRFFQQNASSKRAPFIRTGGILVPGARKGDPPKLAYILKQSVTIPQRRFLGWNDRAADRMKRILLEHIRSGFGKGPRT